MNSGAAGKWKEICCLRCFSVFLRAFSRCTSSSIFFFFCRLIEERKSSKNFGNGSHIVVRSERREPREGHTLSVKKKRIFFSRSQFNYRLYSKKKKNIYLKMYIVDELEANRAYFIRSSRLFSMFIKQYRLFLFYENVMFLFFLKMINCF